MAKFYVPSVMAGLLASMLSAASATAATIPGLFNTGVDSLGAALVGGATDPNYDIVGVGPSVVMSSIPSSYIPNSAESQWIWQTANGQPTNVTLTFTTTFDLTGFDPSTVSITGRWAVDNAGDDILVNGISTGQTAGTFTSWFAFSLDNGFVDGVNTISFVARDFGSISGFRAEFLTADADLATTSPIPVPAALPLLLTALGALALKRRRA